MWLWCRGRMFPSSENIWCSSLLSPIFSLISVTESYRSAMLCGSNGSADMSDQKEFQPLSPYFYMRPRISIRACVCPLVGSSEKCTKGFISPILSLPFYDFLMPLGRIIGHKASIHQCPTLQSLKNRIAN